MIPQEADQTHIEYGFPVFKLRLVGRQKIWLEYVWRPANELFNKYGKIRTVIFDLSQKNIYIFKKAY